MFLYDASMRYQAAGVPLVILAGAEYGSGSSRDWAAKGTRLLGVRAVIAQSYERIHRSNLVGMGVLPLQFLPGESAASLGLDGRESFDITGLGDALAPAPGAAVRAGPRRGRPHVPGDLPARRTHRAGLLPAGRHPAGGPATARRVRLTTRPDRRAGAGSPGPWQGILPADLRRSPVAQRHAHRSLPTR